MTPFLLCLLLALSVTKARADENKNAPLLYPFLRDGKWGYIDSNGAWAIEPRFDRCIEMFTSDRVLAGQGNRWGYIDRGGRWIVEPHFTELGFGSWAERYEIARIGQKEGILERSGKLLLPVKYDDIVFFEDRAWVRSGDKLGVFALDGHWILKPTVDWPRSREMPTPTNGDVSWFKRGKKWGLLSRDGKVLFEPQFAEHVMGRKEAEDWNHPEGLDFRNGRAWVRSGKEYWLITDEGKVPYKERLQSVRAWTDDLYVFVNNDGKQGLISKDGEIRLAARFSKIEQPTEGFAVVAEQRSRKRPDGETDSWSIYGYIDERGKIIVEPGIYAGLDVRDGDQSQLSLFSDGLAPVWNNPPGDTYDPYAGYIDYAGTPVIPEQFLRTERFSEGLGAILERKALGHGLSPERGLWGYVDKTGELVIPARFGWTTPFCRERAWVLKPGSDPQQPFWAMIDRTGKVLTDYAFEPPERGFLGGYFRKHSDAERLRKSRWRGNLAVVSRYDFHNGLATADGKILVEPIFNRINEFHDGVAVAVDSRTHDDKGSVTFVTALITERGEILANNTYSTIGDFDQGAAWASHRRTDHRGPYQREGWGLIDTSARELCELKYVKTDWVWNKDDPYTGDRCPIFYDQLAPVALAEGNQPYGDKVWLLNSWGYINRAGKIIAWHEKSVK